MSQRSICAALKLLTVKENIPAMINCAHGKDRTGILVALVLSCLGTPREQIIHDYSKSTKGLEPIKERCYKEIVERYHMDISFTQSHPHAIIQMFNHINDKYGSVENYLEAIGFSGQEQDLLRENLGRYALLVDKEPDT
ncbi:hypothetical protein ScPMuIL_006096 [Solemya velum]